MRINFPFVKQLCCKHKHCIRRYDMVKTGGIVEKRHYLECFDCGKRFPLSESFTVSAGVFAEIEDRVERERFGSELRAKAQAYANEHGLDVEV